MSAAVKIAGVATLAGLMMTVAVIAAVTEPRAPEAANAAAARAERDPFTAELARCRALTMPDSGCEAAWAAHQRRFFGREGNQP
ncbi:putative entry exclusion protein TrbK-alt [Sphingomonadaceae bacterium G21617-S1]|jgi:conjugative transfer region protein TrbK|uniref:putative entry exclusion protein TrbK-alt n=1 Tax=Afipia sp. DC4300-2b1 TaxID=2804672 RepID=UPI0022C6BF44|nr:putative entry exclusion protein TrbK-alt [Sphingomonadaceae bacterium G21617-S1]